MGVDLNGIRQRRENRKKDDEVLVPEIFDRNSEQEERINKLMPNSKQADGTINIDGAMHDLEKLMRDADKGKFLGMGKDGKLDGNEMRAGLEKIEAKGIEIPRDVKVLFDKLSRIPDFEIDIEQSKEIMREVFGQFDRNHDGALSPKEMQAAQQQMEKGETPTR